MSHLIFFTATNSLLKIQRDPFKIYFKKDAKYVFIPEAEKFSYFHGENEDTYLIGMDCRWRNKKWKRHMKVLDAIETFPNQIDSVSFFCHGWPKGIQFGFNGKRHAKALGEVLMKKNVKKVILYACSCAKPKKHGNFAEWLAEYSGAEVYAHTTKGPATFNPYVNRLIKDKDINLFNGLIIAPKTPLWPLWRKELKQSETFRFEFPFMTITEIKNRLLKVNSQ